MPNVKDKSGKWGDGLSMIPTRAPRPLWAYLSWVSKNPALGVSTLQEFLSLSALEFLLTKPWTRGLKIRQSESIGTAPRMTAGPNNIVQANVCLCPVVLPDGRTVTGPELRKMFEDAADEAENLGIRAVRADGRGAKVTTATLAYTFLFWLATIKYPPGTPLTYLRRFTPADAAETAEEAAR